MADFLTDLIELGRILSCGGFAKGSDKVVVDFELERIF